MGLHKRLFGILIAILAGVAGSSAVEACYSYSSSYQLPHLDKVPIIIQGRPVATQYEGVVRAFSVEHTYKGPVRKRWTVVGPLSSKWPSAAPVYDEPDFGGEPKSSSYIVGIVKLDRPHHERIRQRLEKLGSRAEYMAVGGDGSCWQPFYLAVTKSLSTRLAIATGQLGSKDGAERERLLRKHLGFRVGQFGLKGAVAEARTRMLSLFGRYGHAFDTAGVLNDLSAHVFFELKGQKGRMDLESHAHARKNPDVWLEKLVGRKRNQLTQHHRELMWMLHTFDKNGDGTVDQREMASAVSKSFSFYDKDKDGIADDFDDS